MRERVLLSVKVELWEQKVVVETLTAPANQSNREFPKVATTTHSSALLPLNISK